jgi:RNA polymerase sigma factor (sigma-70 family)
MDEPDDQIWQAVLRLPARQRATVVMRYYLGYPDHDIADVLGCRESSVRSLATRAFQALRPELRSTP